MVVVPVTITIELWYSNKTPSESEMESRFQRAISSAFKRLNKKYSEFSDSRTVSVVDAEDGERDHPYGEVARCVVKTERLTRPVSKTENEFSRVIEREFSPAGGMVRVADADGDTSTLRW